MYMYVVGQNEIRVKMIFLTLIIHDPGIVTVKRQRNFILT